MSQSLVDAISALSRDEQEAVQRFVEYLRHRSARTHAQSPFQAAADEFILEHPELLQRLAQ
jgi:hypothetical protein